MDVEIVGGFLVYFLSKKLLSISVDLRGWITGE
jgi:hypothetical protein